VCAAQRFSFLGTPLHRSECELTAQYLSVCARSQAHWTVHVFHVSVWLLGARSQCMWTLSGEEKGFMHPYWSAEPEAFSVKLCRVIRPYSVSYIQLYPINLRYICTLDLMITLRRLTPVQPHLCALRSGCGPNTQSPSTSHPPSPADPPASWRCTRFWFHVFQESGFSGFWERVQDGIHTQSAVEA
jgi:hypothetical protein